MEVMWIVLPMALAISAIAVLVFIWAVRSGQFDDLVTPSLRVLVDDEPGPGRVPSPLASDGRPEHDAAQPPR